jgi:uncharacterized damage-inducible protein DinB
MRHQMLSERRFFGEFVGFSEPEPKAVLPVEQTAGAFIEKLGELALERLDAMAAKEEKWWLGKAPFFDVERERIWIFWRRLLHTAHHRAQLTGYLRILNKPVPPIYGPTADATRTEDSARRA